MVNFAIENKGWTYDRIGEKFNIPSSVVRFWVKKAGYSRGRVQPCGYLKTRTKQWASYIKEHCEDGVGALMAATGLSWVAINAVARNIGFDIGRKKKRCRNKKEVFCPDYLYSPLFEESVKSCKDCEMKTAFCIYGFKTLTTKCLAYRQKRINDYL